MTATPVALSATDADALSRFQCSGWRAPWADVVEELVQERLADELERSTVDAAGIWVNEALVAVAAWRVRQSRCESILVAVAHGHQRRGLARLMKEHVIRVARESGCIVVVSDVHLDNDSMIELNISLGANVERIKGDANYCRCIIPL